MLKFRNIVCLILLLSSLKAFSQFQPKKGSSVKVIFDTDFGPDYDDVGAIAMLHAYADSGYVDILATIASTRYEGVAATLNAYNTFYKRPQIPIGVPVDALNRRDWQYWSDTVRLNYPHQIKENRLAYDAISLYRKLLAEQKDNSVVIVTVGFFSNIANLLKSSPDQYSTLSGKALVEKKVKLMVSMAGGFPKGNEFNVNRDAASGYYTFQHFNKPVLFTGFEIGRNIFTGLPMVNNTFIKRNPVKDAFRISIPKNKQDINGRMSWDQTAVLLAAIGYERFYDIKRGKIVVLEDGKNEWIDNQNGNHAYVIEKVNPKIVEKYIEEVMAHQPKGK